MPKEVNKIMIEISTHTINAVQGLIKLDEVKLFKDSNNEIVLNLFMPRLNGYDFDYLGMQNSLLEVIITFALDRRTIQRYEENKQYAKLHNEARSKFKEANQNQGELGEVLLYTLLEGHLRAPQILSKMSMKTNSNDYVKGSDGIHFVKVKDSNRYHLIYGESKLYKDLTKAFDNAFKSISRFSSSENLGNRDFELSLIRTQIDNEIIDEEDKDLVVKILYPSEKQADFAVSDAFGIFIGFEINVEEERNHYNEDRFEIFLKDKINDLITEKITTLERQINKHALTNKNFYIYLMPFTDIDESRKEILKKVIE